MNEALATALNEALHRLGDALPDDWRRIVMVKNEGPIPVPAHPVTGDAGRGFNLLLLSRRGDPTWYVRCRDADDVAATREADLLSRLSQSPDIAGHIPEAASGRSDGLQVLATRYLDGVLLAHLLRGMREPEWREALFALTDLVTSVGQAAKRTIPGFADSAPFVFRAEAATPLGRLARSGLTGEQSAALDEVLARAGSAERFPQHGDLWPGNIIRERGAWRLLDFELFGQVEAPLFDVCHLTFTSTEYLLTGGHGFDRRWISYIQASSPLGEGTRAVLRRSAEAHRLQPRQAVGALVFYLVEVTDRLRQRGAAPAVWSPLLAEVVAVADLVRAGASLERAFFPGMSDA